MSPSFVISVGKQFLPRIFFVSKVLILQDLFYGMLENLCICKYIYTSQHCSVHTTDVRHTASFADAPVKSHNKLPGSPHPPAARRAAASSCLRIHEAHRWPSFMWQPQEHIKHSWPVHQHCKCVTSPPQLHWYQLPACRCSHLMGRFIARVMGSVTIPPEFSHPLRAHVPAHLDHLDWAATYSQHLFLLCKVRVTAVNVAVTMRAAIPLLIYRRGDVDR